MREYRNEIYVKGMLHLIRLALLMLAVVFATGTVSHVAASTGMAIAMAVEADMADGIRIVAVTRAAIPDGLLVEQQVFFGQAARDDCAKPAIADGQSFIETQGRLIESQL